MSCTPHPFLQLVINRAHGALKRLDTCVWKPLAGIPVTEATEVLSQPVPLDEAMRLPRKPLRPPESWGKLYDFRWFRVVVPPAKGIAGRYLRWDDQSQACAWLNGVPYHGFDEFHRYCPVPDEGGEFWIEGICHCVFDGQNPAGTLCNGATLFTRDDEAWSAYHGVKVLYDLAMQERHDLLPAMGRGPKAFGYQPALETVPPLYRRILRHLDTCITALDTGGLAGLNAALEDAYAALRNDSRLKLRCTLIGHAHLDLVWLWPERIGEFKAQHTLASMNRLMDSYPEFRFLWTQTASYRAVQKRAPALAEAVSRRIKEGRWEATGAMEVESDTLLACGEALARSLALGQEQFRELTGKPSSVLWLPDVFGYSGCLPQLMRAFDVDYFFTTKLSWNALNRFPYSSFRWRGTDGAEVIAHLTQDIGYNCTTGVDEITLGERSYRQADVHDEFLIPTGWGDGGGGTTPEMCERARRLSSLGNMPRVAWDTATAFFDRLAEVADRLPVYEGELYFEYHRGTYTTHGGVKSAFRATERALQAAEAAHAAAGLGPVKREWWERAVFAQFHDYIPGSSIPPVYLEAIPDLERVARAAQSDAGKSLSGGSGDACLFNPLPLPVLVNLDGCRVLELPPLAGVRTDDAAPVPPTVASERGLANESVEARFNDAGFLTGLTVRGRPVALGAEGAGRLWIYKDHAALFEAWDIDRQALDTGSLIDSAPEISCETRSDGAAVLTVRRRAGTASTVTLRYILRPGRDVLEIEADCDWHEECALLKIEFPTGYLGQMARFGAPFGSVMRPQKQGDPRAEAMWEVPGSRYAVVLDDSSSEGLFLVTEAKYGFSCRDGRLALSLLRSPRHTGMDGEAHESIYPGALRTEPPVPIHTDQGQHHIRLAIGLYTGELSRAAQPAALAESLFAEPIRYAGAPRDAGLLAVEGAPSLIPSWAQPLDGNSWILRLHEVLGRRGEVTLQLAPGWTATRSTFAGNVSGNDNGTGRFAFGPYEIVSVVLRK